MLAPNPQSVFCFGNLGNKWEIKYKTCTTVSKFKYITASLNKYINLREIIRHLNKWISILNLKIGKIF